MPDDEHCILLEPYQAVYIDIAKVASSSIKATLAAALGLDDAGGNPHEVGFPRPPAASPAGPRLFPDHYAFAFVRNPWTRLVSCYRDKIRGEVGDFTGFAESGVAHCLAHYGVFTPAMTFADFVHAVAAIPDDQADEHFRAQAGYVTNAAGAIAVDFVGRYESFTEDFAHVGRTIGLPTNLRLPKLQAAPPADPAGYYTPAIIEIVARRYQRDLALFGYRWDSQQGSQQGPAGGLLRT